MIRIRENEYQEMVTYCKGKLPLEACGRLAGRINDGNSEIEKIYCLSNADESRNHFSMIPKEQFHAIKDMREKGYELLGNFHSHPSTGAVPSREDLRLACDRHLIYLLLSLKKEEETDLRAYRIDGEGNVIFEPIIRVSGTVSGE